MKTFLIIMSVLALIGLAVKLFGKKSKKPSATPTPTHHPVREWLSHNWEKWFWGFVRLGFAIWLVMVIAGLFQNRPPPPPPKVYGPTEILYTLDMRNDEGNLVNFEGKVVSNPEEYFAITVKGLDYFEGWYPRVNSMKPNKDRLIFSQSFGDKFGVWKDIDGRSKNVKHRGTIQILRDLEYQPNKIGPIRGTFWKEGADTSKKEGSFNFTLYPPKMLTVTKTLAYWE